VVLTDTHCHIHAADGQASGEKATLDLWQKADMHPQQMINDAHKIGVERLICVGTTLQDSQAAIAFASDHKDCWATIGLHPHEASQYVGKPELLSQFAALATQPKVVAVGECGLDYYYNHSPKAAQQELLRFQLQLAQDYKLPLVFHIRDAFADFWPIFDEFEGLTGVVHSFTATQSELNQALERGLYIGLNGIVTFTKQPEQLATAKAVPLHKLLLETDAPYLTPSPFRGTICQPKHVRVTAEFLSHLRDETLEDLATATTHNAAKLFKLI
jgi:TatD DNase family protein